MKWKDVRKAYPDQFVLFSIIRYHEVDDKKIVEEVAPIRPIPDQDATKEFFSVPSGQLVYHTSNEECIIHIRKDSLMRVRRADANTV